MGCACSKPVAAQVARPSSTKGDLGMRDTQPLLSANNGISDDGQCGTIALGTVQSSATKSSSVTSEVEASPIAKSSSSSALKLLGGRKGTSGDKPVENMLEAVEAKSSDAKPPPQHNRPLDPRWTSLFSKLSAYLLDPEDLPSVLDSIQSSMINNLSPTEIMFIKVRVESSLRSVLGVEDGDLSKEDTKRTSLSRKVGKIVGSVSFSNHSSTVGKSEQGSIYPVALDESDGRTKSSKSAYKEGLLDISTVRKVFENGDMSLRQLREPTVGALPDVGDSPQGKLSRRISISKTTNDSVPENDICADPGKLNLEKIDIYASTFLILLYLSESRWDQVAQMAKAGAERAGLTLDVNKLALQAKKAVGGSVKKKSTRERSKEILAKGATSVSKTSRVSVEEKAPLPPLSQPAASVNSSLAPPETAGIRFNSLCYMISHATRGTRLQKLVLLFHLLMPTSELNDYLNSNPVGIPSWLFEVDRDVVLSYDSLSYYYNYDGVLLPNGDVVSEAAPSASVDKSNVGLHMRIDAKCAIEILATVVGDALAGCAGAPSSSSSASSRESCAEPVGMQRLTNILSSSGPDTHSNQVASGSWDIHGMLDMHGVRPSVSLSNKTLHLVKTFVKCSSSVNASSQGSGIQTGDQWSLSDFVAWSSKALSNSLLNSIMHRLFGTGMLTDELLERDLVSREWSQYNAMTASGIIGDVHHFDRGTSVRAVRGSLASTDKVDDEVTTPSTNPIIWGGIGNVDGKGGLCTGLLYCIDKVWWDGWKSYVGWEFNAVDASHDVLDGNASLSRSPKRPRELSTERLLDRSPQAKFVPGSFGSVEIMKENLVREVDYVLVPPGVWNILYEIYGGGPPLPRMILPRVDDEIDGRDVMNRLCSASVSVEHEYDSVEIVSQAKLPHDGLTQTSLFSHPVDIPSTIQVETNPWIVHAQICDPQQPYRRGDAGPRTIRIMCSPSQPLWRLLAETIIRLPICHSKARDQNGEGRARLWKYDMGDDSTQERKDLNPASRFGPWALLCPNRCTDVPVGGPHAYDEYVERWQAYSDEQTVESAGLIDGIKIMFEYALVTKDGSFTWPREAAAKATALKRTADEDNSLRFLLRGLNDEGKPLKKSLVRTPVDAMDTSGRWYRGIIVNAETVQSDSNGSTSLASKDNFVENTHVRVHFDDGTDNHQEWIDVKSDRIAVAGRFTASSLEKDSEHDEESGAASIESKLKLTMANKKKDSTTAESNADPNSGGGCTFVGYGACGLDNLGNTCYMNSGLQCLSYLPLLRSYILSGQFKTFGDINRNNPLGTGGKILEEFSELLHFMWCGKYGKRAPQKFRNLLAKCRNQYSGADQQDAQELVNDMFDMLHEDGNRVTKKPYVEALEDEFIAKTPLPRVGEEAWRRFQRRNRSAVSDLLMGQVYNQVTCPKCSHTSRNFDPFNMLSLPFPTMPEVIFRCIVVRRGTALNCLGTLKLSESQIGRLRTRSSSTSMMPPSKELIFEEYIVPMSRLADIGDLKMKLQHMTGVSAARLRMCKHEEIASTSTNDPLTKIHSKVTALPDKEGPCVKLLQNAALDDTSTPTVARIMAFETTLNARHIDVSSVEESTTVSPPQRDGNESTADEMSDDEATMSAPNRTALSKADERGVQEILKVYGDEKECFLYDTNPTLLAKVISRSLWPESAEGFNLGLRVDAIDHRNRWFPGSVIEIVTEGKKDDDGVVGPKEVKVKVHFDNFASKWDEEYTLESFTEGRVCPLYSHASARSKPSEFVVHHRGTNAKSGEKYLFGQSFYIQCYNEWSTARAGAHILSQASRFIESSSPLDCSKHSDRSRRDARKVIKTLIRDLIDFDRQNVQAAVKMGGRQSDEISFALQEKVKALLPLLPFEIRVTAATDPLGISHSSVDEHRYPFNLVRTIGNYMTARQSLVLDWKGNNLNQALERILYSPPPIVQHKQSHKLLKAHLKETGGNDPRRSGLNIGVCLTEFCKEQQLDGTGCWRCPVCKKDREGRQSMTLWNLPDILTFHMKRFNASSRWREKITTRVDFPLTGLNMREWCAKESPQYMDSNEEDFVYDLVGVVNHYGGMTGGHYVATCKATKCSPNGNEDFAYDFSGSGLAETDSLPEVEPSSGGWAKIGRSKEKDSLSNGASKAVSESSEPLWLQFDDELVEPLPPRNVVSETAYVLFYKRRRMRPSNIAKYSTLLVNDCT